MNDQPVFRDEIDILYSASHKLTQAGTPAEQLAAVSEYARDQGASSGALFYIDDDAQGQPEWMEIVAEWVSGARVAIGPDFSFYMPSFAFNRVWLATPDRPTLVADALSSDDVDAASRANYLRMGIRGAALLPLNIKGRWVGVLMFTWSEPHTFSERDQRIYTALLQQAAPVIDSVRLFEGTQRRAAELESAKSEIDLLYAASNKLAHALTPADWLEAVSDYARDNGASAGVLFYVVQGASGHPEWLDVAAEWNVREGGQGEGRRFRIPDYANFVKTWLSRPNAPMLLPDVLTTDLVDPVTPQVRELYADYHMRGCAVLPLTSQGRWVGILLFVWEAPHTFNDRDRRVFTALLQGATPVIDSVRLFADTRERAARAEQLLEVNAALSRALDEDDILMALALFARRHDPTRITLSYFDVDNEGDLVDMRDVAVWVDGALATPDRRIYRLSEYPAAQVWLGDPGQILLVDDAEADPRLNDRSRMLLRARGTRGLAVIPLHSGSRWQAVAAVEWREPHPFTPQESAIYSALIQTTAAVVTSRRAYVAEEEARRESELLYRVSEAVNASTTFQELADSVAILFGQSHSVALTVWENYDFDTATYFEVVAESGKSVQPVGARYATADYPMAAALRKGLQVMEDIANDPRVDPVSASSWLALTTRARIGVPLALNNRWMGTLAFLSQTPRTYTMLEKRLVIGIGDLVIAALERLRLYDEMVQARKQAEILAALEERNRLARELHDSVSQALYGIALGARTARTLLDRDPTRVAEPLDYVLGLAEAGLTEMRALIFQLRPESLATEGLVSALHKQAASIQARHGIVVTTELLDEPDVSLEVKAALYLIAREALHNTVKHAKARQVSVRLTCSSGGCTLDIRDDGIGFDATAAYPGHLGLKSMTERVAKLNGRLTMTSAPGEGTHIEIVIGG